ncbi:hypothetical protein GCM10023214_45970 [Amycolatopsis dongchuanensis]|uniref:Uncharacterized protein n=1 Tax=Amycolatopsis dongchuanensis TaxID=1070866 RepID=A0ABP9QY61_9PSEU
MFVQQGQDAAIPVGQTAARSGHGRRRHAPPQPRGCVMRTVVHRVWHRSRAYYDALTCNNTAGTRQVGSATLRGLPNGIPNGIPM